MSIGIHNRLKESLKFIKSKTDSSPQIAIILGSGFGTFADELKEAIAIDYREIPHHPISTVEGHAGRMVFGKAGNIKVLALQGRVHLYEGYSIQVVTYPVHLMAELGVKDLVVTNAAGGINPNFSPGNLMIITDHINFSFENPLIGSYDPDFGPDMSEPYSRRLIEAAEKAALDLGIKIQKGVLVIFKGPSYETPAEVRMIKTLGGDAVTMSTVPEVIAAKQREMRVLGISCITNMATGISPKKLNHHEITQTVEKAKNKFIPLFKEIINRIATIRE